MSSSFPRQYGRTRRFTAGAPRTFRVAADGTRVAFLRSSRGDDPVHDLWVLDLASGEEVKMADARALSATPDEDLPDAERARRERARESGGGIVAYDADPDLTRATFTLGGRLHLADLLTGETTTLPSTSGAFDPRLSPDGWLVAYVAERALRVSSATTSDLEVIGETDPAVSWGAAEFVAAEEMGRSRGHWWAPGGERLLVQRTDVSPVRTWHISSPVDPAAEPRAIRYPAAGTANARVGLSILGLDGYRRDVVVHRGEFEYLTRAEWSEDGVITFAVQSRDQRTVAVFVVDPETGAVEEVHRETADPWIDLVADLPTWAGDRLVVPASVTPPGQHLRKVVHVGEDRAVVIATDDPTQAHVWGVRFDGEVQRLTTEPGIHDAAASGDVLVVSSSSLEAPAPVVRVLRGGEELARIRSLAEQPVVRPAPTLLSGGERELRTAVLLPHDHDGETPLPVLVDPYGGPHALRVVQAQQAFLVPQWFADQGFAVVVADGRGTPGRGAEWEHAVHGDLATAPLDDQVAALEAAAERHPFMDLRRVAIRGWSFGGYLAALAVLRRPDVFHAAIAGAPVTDWRLYDTHYTERYLGHPDDHPERYEATSLLPLAARLRHPLLLIHGLADDNVVAAHTLQLSRALLEAGRPHTVLPLSDVTHMTPQEAVAENLLHLQLAFLVEALGLED